MVEKKTTTKEILQEKLANRKHTPLYDSIALEKLRRELEQWKNTYVREDDRSAGRC